MFEVLRETSTKRSAVGVLVPDTFPYFSWQGDDAIQEIINLSFSGMTERGMTNIMSVGDRFNEV